MNRKLQKIRIGDLVLDIENQIVTRGSNRIDMAGLSFRLLSALAKRSPAAVGRRDLVREVWGDTVVSDDTVRQRIRLLRQSLGESGYVEAVKGFGYRLASPTSSGGLSDRRREILLAVSLVAVGVMIYLFAIGDLKHEWLHAIKHAIRH